MLIYKFCIEGHSCPFWHLVNMITVIIVNENEHGDHDYDDDAYRCCCS